MKRKRMKKLLMSMGYSRRDVDWYVSFIQDFGLRYEDYEKIIKAPFDYAGNAFTLRLAGANPFDYDIPSMEVSYDSEKGIMYAHVKPVKTMKVITFTLNYDVGNDLFV